MPDGFVTTELEPGTRLVANVGLYNGIVLNQSCDLVDHPERGRPIVISRLVPAEERVTDFKESNSLKRKIKAVGNIANPGKAPSLFYLPEPEHDVDFEMPRSVADLLDVTRYRAADYRGLASLVRLRLSPAALQALQERLSYCFGRFGAPDGLYLNEEEWQAEYGDSDRESA